VSPPLPPSDLASRTPATLRLAAGDILYRFYTLGLEPVYFDTSGAGRLNAPNGSYGVLYAAERREGAFAETFLRTPGRRMIDPALLSRKGLIRLEVLQPATLIAFDGPGLAILGATAEVVHGGLPYDAPQAWSKALRAHPIGAHGIAYGARHDPAETCYALFDTVSVREIARDEDLDVDWFWEVADIYQTGRPPIR
jgi:hypothetical protein